ncbi:hypothetical protein D3C84_1125360 [compost metagenome]
MEHHIGLQHGVVQAQLRAAEIQIYVAFGTPADAKDVPAELTQALAQSAAKHRVGPHHQRTRHQDTCTSISRPTQRSGKSTPTSHMARKFSSNSGIVCM